MLTATWQHGGVDAISNLESEWKDLENESPTATPFQTWDWHDAYARLMSPRGRLQILALREGNDLVGLMPFVKTRGFWRSLRPHGIGPSDYLHPLARTGYEQEVADRIHQALAERSDVDLVDLHQVRETTSLAGASKGRLLTQATCLTLDLPRTYDQYLSRLGKSLRYDARKLDKGPFSTGLASITFANERDLDYELDIFLDLHRRRWKERHLPGAFFGRVVAFHREWSRRAGLAGRLRLGTLRVEGVAVGSIYAMAMGGTTYFYQAGFDPAYRNLSPGTLLVAHTIRSAIAEGQRTFDFMRGDESYKRRWMPQNTFRNLRILQPAGGVSGALGSRWNEAGSNLESRIRARLEGRALW